MKRVTNGFGKFSIAEFSQKLDLIITSMTGNAGFPTIQTDAQTISAAADAQYPLVTQADQQGKAAKTERNATRKKLTKQLHALGGTGNRHC